MSDEYGGPKVITIAPPVQIFHPVFQQFLDRIDDPTFAPDEEVVARVSCLMSYSSRLHPSGDDAPVKLRGHLAVLLQGHMMQGMLFDPRSPGGVVARHEVNRTIPLITFEYRRSICEGGCGPTVQRHIISKTFSLRTRSVLFAHFAHSPVVFLTWSSAQGTSQHVLLSVFPTWWRRRSYVHTRRGLQRQVHCSASN